MYWPGMSNVRANPAFVCVVLPAAGARPACVTFDDGILINCKSSSESSCINIVSIKEQLF